MYTPNDKLAQKAKKMGLRARSVFKLEELDWKYKLFAPGMKVLDIGAAPGSWLQYVSGKIGDSGMAAGVDLKEIENINSNVVTVVCDVTNKEEFHQFISSLGWEHADIVISDIAPNTTGIKYVDQLKSVELNNMVFAVAKKYLAPGGYLVMKVFPGEHFVKFTKDLKAHFKNVDVIKVSATRDSSREVYVICK